MKNPKIKTRVAHSRTKSAWNVIGETPGGKHKVAIVPQVSIGNEATIDKSKTEAYEHAKFISYCFNNSGTIVGTE